MYDAVDFDSEHIHNSQTMDDSRTNTKILAAVFSGLLMCLFNFFVFLFFFFVNATTTKTKF